jgi:tetratricopeptide (TPR) repeat protein
MRRAPAVVVLLCLAAPLWGGGAPRDPRAPGHPQDPVQTQAAPGGHTHYTPAPLDQPNAAGQLAPRLQKLGPHTFPVSTTVARAQLFMNQGLNLSYAFNHAEAGRAFREAARLDPNLAMAYWGQALVLGPNINAAMEPADEAPALAAIEKAASLRARATAKERILITALRARYAGKPEERPARDAAYADAMRRAHLAYPLDNDIATLYVESLMDLRPWGYWMRDGVAYDGIADAVALIERVLARSPRHPGALHLYIHLVEAHAPRKAEGAADRLLTLMPAAGHMVHMPAHIYQRVGRYKDAIRSNQLAVAADEDYITQCRAQGLYPMGYYPHNLHFLWWAATADGNEALALESARKTASKVDPDALRQLPLLAAFKVVPYFALTQFKRWDEMLAEPPPGQDNVFLYGIYHYARGLALVGKGRLDEADRALSIVSQLQGQKALDAPLFSPNLASAVFAIAPLVLGGEIALARRQYDTAIAAFERAVRLDDGLVYTEPAEWHFPPRHALARALIAAGRAAEAETVLWDDMRRYPNSHWAVTLLVDALTAQGKTDQAALVAARRR